KLRLDADALGNAGAGLLSGWQGLTVTGGSLDNSAGGTLSSKDGELAISLGGALDNHGQGALVSKGAQWIDAASLDNAQGIVSGESDVTLSIVGKLDNGQGGLVSAQRALSFERDDTLLNNAGGRINGGSLLLKGASLDNSDGQLISQGRLDAILGGALVNAGAARLASGGDLLLRSASVDNRGGKLVSQGLLEISAGSLDNSASGTLASQAGMSLRLGGGALRNQQDGLIFSQAGALEVQAGSLDNRQGTLQAQGDNRLRIGGALDNQGGRLDSRAGNLDLQSGSLDNGAGGVHNSAKGWRKLVTGLVDNSAGGTQAQSLEIRAGLGVRNQQGHLSALSGDNRIVTADFDNQGGRLDSRAGNLDLQSGSLDNGAGGVLNSAKGWLKLVTGLFDNSAGVTQAQSLEIRAGQGVRNQQGHLSALSGDNRIVTADFDNQGGGLYASGLLSLDGQRFLNQGAAAGQGGKVGAGRIDFSLAGALANRFGQLESESELHLRAAAIDNSGGSLRALGRSGSTRLVAGGLNNAYGVLESANQDLDLQLGSLANAGGRILHTGNGTFGLDSGQVIRAGGELTTNGLLDIRASEWTNSSVLQAGRLNLDIGTFRQTAEGKLLAVQSFTGRGGDWSNDGLLASDGSLRLDLSGGYRGNGRATSLGDFALNAASLDLGNAASLAGGANVTLGAGNLLVNRGRITAAGDLVASAASLNNYGTLGGGGNLRLNAPALLNERGLLFSGADMTLRAGDITNLYGDVYSLGRLDIARDDAGGWASSVNNRSSTIEAVGNATVRAEIFENKVDAYSSSETLEYGDITFDQLDGGRTNVFYVDEFYKSNFELASPVSSFSVGGALKGWFKEFNNFGSTVSAGGDVELSAENFSNLSIASGDYTRNRVFKGPTDRWSEDKLIELLNDGGGIETYQRRNSKLIHDYYSVNCMEGSCQTVPYERKYQGGGKVNPLYGKGNAVDIPKEFNSYTLISDAKVFREGGYLPSVIESGRTVSLVASGNLYNGDIKQWQDYTASRKDWGSTTVGKSSSVVDIVLHSQLPPDLARQQINPLTLPGFSLPQGQNGLFRLASQGAQVNQASGALKSASDLTQSGHGVSVSAQAGSDASGWSTQARRVGDDRVTSLAGSAYQGRVAEAIDALRASAPISGDGGNTGRFQAGEHQATTGLGGLVEGNASGHSGNGVILADLRGGLPSFSSLPAADRVQGTVPGHDGNGTILANWQGAQATVQASPSTVRVEGVVSSPGGNGSILAGLPAEQSSVQALPSAVRAQGSLPRLEERSAVLAEPPVGQPALQTLPSVARVEGVPSNATPSNSHKYLIETNPALTELKQFLNSDYLLGGLGINPDDSKKRLGDGLYEQRLVREAIVQRTGQRFIAGLNSDEAMFRYLMDNAIASKDVLGLTPGVTLSAAQVAALTHDIVWLEEVEVLRAGDITNLYGDVYSLGRLDIARGDAGNRAASLRNLSGVIESGKDFSLRASLIENRRAVLESKSGLYTAKMEQTACIEGVNAGDCSGKRNAIWTITQRDKTEVTASSAMGQLLAGGDFAIDGGTLNNLSSLIGSGGNLTANLEVLDNQGLETGELETIRVLRTARGGDIGGIDQKSRNFTNLYWYQSANFDPARAGEIPAALNAILSDWSFEYEFPSKGPTPISSGDQSYAAVIQAAGDVTVNASTRIDNGVTRPGYTFVGSGRQVGDSAVGGSGVSVVVPLTSQLPPDLARRQVNPVTLPGFSLPQGDNGLFRLSSRFAEDGNGSAALGAGADRTQGGSGVSVGQQGAGNAAGTWQGQGVRVDGLAGAANVQGQGGSTLGGSLPGVAQVQGVPGNATPSASHKYLIETNPALTELKQFLNSDYLLSGLGMNPDDSKKRLGDGLYEQRLIRDAVVARTGQRYIDGLSSDEALFRYLMDNAIAYKDQLHLQLGVGLSAEQMAALTHDIVWLEEVEVNGEKVLAPVVYLAQAEGRLAPNGALIQGRDVKLVSGGDLHNVGTLRARNDLSATADNLDNSGLIEAGKRLDLLAGDSIRNRQGGVIAGRDVSLTALTGDVTNERSVTRYDSALDGRTWERSFADSAARVEAANSLNVQAGRDIANLGGVLQSRGDLSLDAGRDVTVAAVEDRQGQTRWSTSRLQSVTQLGAEVSAGRDLNVSAGRDLSAVASALEARRDIALSAGRDVTLAAAANEEHAYSKTRKVTYQEDKVAQQGTRVDAGGDLAINAGQDLRLIASQASAGDEAYLVAGDKLELLAANDSNYYLYDKKKKGDFGRKETRRDEVTDVKAVGSQISSGGDLTLLSGGDQTYQGAKLESGNDLAIVSGGAVTFEAVKDLHQESHEKSKGDLAWQSSKGKGQTDETVRQSQIVAQGNLAIKAVEGLKIDLKHIDQKTVSQTIDAMVQADPQLAWLKEAEQRGDVDWRMVQEVHDSWKYSNSGLGAAPSLAIAIVAAAYLGPVYGAMASNLAIGTINNGGDLGKGLQQATSADSLKGYAIAAATAYLVSPQLDKAFGVSSDNINKVTKGFKLSTVEGIGGFAAYSIAQGFAQSVMQQAAYGGSYIDNLGNAMAGQARNLGMAVGFNFIGDSVKYPDGSPPKIMAHALMGGLLAEASGSDFKTGAAAAGANEAMINLLGKMVGGDQNLELMASQLVGVAAASAVNGDVSLGAEIAKSGTAYNRQLHPDEIKFASDVERVKRYAQENGLSEDTARKELLSTAAMMVDNGWNQALAGTDINAARAAQYLRTELGTGPDSNLFQVTQADYYNERVGLTALFKNKEALTSVLENIALANPASYTRDPANRAEVLNAKGEGSQAGFGLALEGIVSAPSKTALWLMGALTCSSCAERDIQNAWNSVASLPEDIRMKGYLDALHTMQGQGASVVRDNAASSTALGVEVGLAIDGGLAGAGKGVVTDGPKGILTLKDFPDVSTKISQKQLRHIAGTQQLEARGGGGFLNSVSDAQKVLDAYHTGQVKILGRNAQGFPVVKFEGVTGTNVNLGVGITDQATNVFIIKGTKSPSIVPTNPNWSPK
ncbi:DUF637 domain-containing protein, partial [Pseudomonas aeruginosa]